ncbi:protein EPIDERMAL PATTERNING FACTOR 1-like [Diospyros lotus]|uniref:protein EPIDERMAL PATTERNING FACTOR 1-like n=1 Tax=Diospyros lotus TaxID=55363 RepID=UPI0022595135|nr:protein EPIDERMAL PATTERNING FACTOR 1-like [Diospyros lotus]
MSSIAMKGFCWIVVLLAVVSLPAAMSARHIVPQHSGRGHRHPTAAGVTTTGDDRQAKSQEFPALGRQRLRAGDTLQVAGSRLPDCSHACGSCSPCRLVMVSFVCALLAEAETCPMAYKCMCNNKSYPVP